jgi:ATP-dependent RNA helicase CshB
MIKFKNEYLNYALDKLEFTELTEVQALVIEKFDQVKDMVVEAKTGSGKTHAFLLPILDRLDYDLKEVQAVIIAPTRELALQINRFAQELIASAPNKPAINLYIGGEDRASELEWLEKNTPQIVIGTPGKLKDLVITENVLKIHTAKYMVIDEADMTLDNNFIEAVDALAYVTKDAKFLVFSATIPEYLRPFLRKYMNAPMILEVHPEEISNLNIKHYFIKTKEIDRFIWLERIVETINPYLAIVFCNTKESANEVADKLALKGINCCLIHGDIDYRRRKQLIKRINNLEFQYIVATDIIARGIDIIGVSHVINYELPRDYQWYIHRSGRTGRINFDGICLSLYEFEDNSYLDKLENKGVKAVYKTIKNGQIIDQVVRNARQNRERPKSKFEQAAKLKVKRNKKVKPGYKKKYKEAVEKETKKLSRKKR